MTSYFPSPLYDSFFAAFFGREDELGAVLERCGIDLSPGGLAALSSPARGAEFGKRKSDPFAERAQLLVHEMGLLSTAQGREAIERVCASHEIPIPGPDYSGPRIAAWFWLNHHGLFGHALELLSGGRRQQIPLGPGGLLGQLAGGAVQVDKMVLEAKLKAGFKREGWTGRLVVQETTTRGSVLEFGVFWEGPAQIRREFGPEGLGTRESRPVREAWLRFNTGLGELEIEGGTPRERELLWKAFTEAAQSKQACKPQWFTLRLDHLLNFQLQTRPGHSAHLSAVRIVGQRKRRPFSFLVQAGGKGSLRELILAEPGLRALAGEKLEAMKGVEGMEGIAVESARIELVLGPGRPGRKVIELNRPDEIRFDRATDASEVYGYLKAWRILRDGMAGERVG